MTIDPARQFGILCLATGAAAAAAIFAFGETSPIGDARLPLALPGIVLLIAAAATGVGAVIRKRAQSGGVFGTAAGLSGGEEAGSPWRMALAALLMVGFSLRLAHLWNYHYCNDEILFVTASGHESLGDALRDCMRHFHPPTNFVMLHYLLKFSWDPLWVRLPSVIGGTLAIGFTFVLVRQLFGLLPGFVAAFVVTFSPNLILLSQVCRNYSPSLPFYLTSLWFLARYLNQPRMGSIVGFAVFEILAIAWHYAYLPAFLGVNVVLFLFLLTKRRPPGHALTAVLAQSPLALIYGFALFYHLPLTHADTQTKILQYMDDEYRLDLANPVRPLVALAEYLVAGSPGLPAYLLGLGFFTASVAGLVLAWRRGHRWQVALCLAYLPFAYFFAFAIHLLPLGGTRHAFFAFPFVIAPAAAALAQLVPGGLREGQVPGIARAPRSPSAGLVSHAGPVILALLGGVYLFSSLREVANVLPYYLRPSPAYDENTPYYRPTFYRAAELPTRTRDLEQMVHLLRRESLPGETVLCSYPTFMILNARLGDPPIGIFFNLHQASSFTWEGRKILFIPEAHYGFTPDSLLVTAAAAARSGALGGAPRVWVAMAGWETWPLALYDWTERVYPEILVETNAWEDRISLFAVRTEPAVEQSFGVLELGGRPASAM